MAHEAQTMSKKPTSRVSRCPFTRIIDVLHALSERVYQDIDRRRPLTAAECEYLHERRAEKETILGESIVGLSGNFGSGLCWKRHELTGQLEAINLDFDHAMRWPPLTCDRVWPRIGRGSIVVLLSYWRVNPLNIPDELLRVLDYLHMQNGRVEEFWRYLLAENPSFRKLKPRTCFLCIPDESHRMRRLESLPPTTPTSDELALTDRQRAVLEVLQSLKSSEAIFGKEILIRMNKTPTASALATLTRHIVPGLIEKGFAVRNAPKRGYYLAEQRPVN
jgi:hypothetical protein